MKILRFLRPLLAWAVLLSTGTIGPVYGWDWLDYVAGGVEDEAVAVNTLSLQEIGEMRVRDIKRRLTRIHGYGADEVTRMLDKKELINALAFEEHKVRERKLDQQKRFLVKRGLIAAVVAVLVVVCWPLLSHAWEVGMVNFVVYTDRKRFEAKRCYELQSIAGFIGCTLMLIVDGLSMWLTVSILGSWVTTSNYFFPVPSLSISPAKMMGGEVASGPLSRYGFNVAPMAISWSLRFVNGQIERWTGRALASAQRELKRRNRENESQHQQEERKARKAARKAAKQAAREQAEAMAQEQREREKAEHSDPSPTENPVFEPNQDKPPATFETASVKDFLGDEFDSGEKEANPESEEPDPSALDDLD